MIELDGFYLKEKRIDELAELIKECKSQSSKQELGQSSFLQFLPILLYFVVLLVILGPSVLLRLGLFQELGIDMMRANNDVVSGIAKVQSYLAKDMTHRNPFTDELGAPHMYFNSQALLD
jgi:hypothetical protein